MRIVQSQTNSTQHVFDDYTLQIIQVVLQLFCIKPKNWQIIVINIHFTLFAPLKPYTLCLTDKFLCALFWHLRNMSIKLAKLYDLRLRINSSKLMCIGPSQTKILFSPLILKREWKYSLIIIWEFLCFYFNRRGCK